MLGKMLLPLVSQKRVGNREVNRLRVKRSFFPPLTALRSFDAIISLFVPLALLSDLLLQDKSA